MCTYEPVASTAPTACRLEDTPLLDFSNPEEAKCCVRWALTGGSATVDGELMAFAYHDPTPDRVLRATGLEWCRTGDQVDCSYHSENTGLPTRGGRGVCSVYVIENDGEFFGTCIFCPCVVLVTATTL